jgi:hypothetical protein
VLGGGVRCDRGRRGVGGVGACGEGRQREQRRKKRARASSARRDSLRGDQRELEVLAILALALEARLAPLIRRLAARRRSARMARPAGVDLVAQLQSCFARRRYEVFT